MIAVLLGISSALLQSVWGVHITLLGVMPDLALLVAIAWTLLQGLGEGMAVAIIAGLTVDILSSAPFGLCSIAFVLVALGAGVAHRNVFSKAWYLPYVTGLWASLLYNVVLILAMQLGGRATDWVALLQRVILPLALANTMAMVLIFGLLRWLSLRISPEKVDWE